MSRVYDARRDQPADYNSRPASLPIDEDECRTLDAVVALPFDAGVGVGLFERAGRQGLPAVPMWIGFGIRSTSSCAASPSSQSSNQASPVSLEKRTTRRSPGKIV